MWKLVFVLVLAALCLTEGRRGKFNKKGKKAGKWLPPNAQNVSWWDRTLVTQTAKEFSFTLPEKADQIYVMSINKRKLKKENFKKSKTLVDFSGGSSVVVLKVKKWCFLLNKAQDLNRDTVLQQLLDHNGQTREATTPVQMYVTKLDPVRSTELQQRPAVSELCGSKRIRGLSTEDPSGTAAATKTFLVTSLDDQLSITLPVKQRGRKKAKKGRGGWRRNKGRAGRN